MTVVVQTPYNEHTGNGVTTVFGYTFQLLAADDLKVYVNGSLVPTADYTVSGVGVQAGGSVTFDTAPANGATVLLSRELALAREIDYQQNGDLSSATIDEDVDRVWQTFQQQNAQLEGVLRAPYPESIGELPSAEERASQFLAFDSGGEPIAASGTTGTVPVSTFMETVLDDTSAAAARTTLGAGAAGSSVFTAGTATAARSALQIGNLQHANGFRLTLTSGAPVTTSDVSGASTLYACPYKGNEIALYASGAWAVYESAQFSLALSGLTSGRPYDVFCYASGTIPTLEVLAWASDTARATALTYQDGVLVKSGDATRRYLGTFYSTSTTTTEDSAANRYLWNYYHRVARAMRNATETTDSWIYTTAAWRQANNNSANRVNFVIGVAEDCISAAVQASANNNTAAVGITTGIGLDSTSALATGARTALVSSPAANINVGLTAHWEGTPGVGRHYLAWLEYSQAAGSTTWHGDGGDASRYQNGISGRVLA